MKARGRKHIADGIKKQELKKILRAPPIAIGLENFQKDSGAFMNEQIWYLNIHAEDKLTCLIST